MDSVSHLRKESQRERRARPRNDSSVLPLEKSDAVLGTGVDACAAVGAKVGGDIRAEVGDLHRALLTRLFALFTADTADIAQLARHTAFIVVGAAHRRHVLFGHDLDDPSGARLDAQGAGAALAAVHIGYAVVDMDRVIGTGGFTVAQTHTAVGAGSQTAADLHRGGTAHDAAVLRLVSGVIERAHALDDSDLRLYAAGLNAEDLGHRFGAGESAGSAESRFRLALGECFGIAGTAGKSARAAVRAGERFEDRFRFFIFGHRHDDRGDGKDQANQKSDAGDNADR